MTFKRMLENYPKQDMPSHEGLCVIVADILKVLAYRESLGIPKHEAQTVKQYKQMYEDSLWKDIINKSEIAEEGHSNILLTDLRKILEKYQILGDEKDGM